MEYPPAFRLQDKTTGKHDLRHMTKQEQFFLSVSDGFNSELTQFSFLFHQRNRNKKVQKL